MSISSINTNLAALLAQVNIGNATQATSNYVSALSSGNRIVSASTDVAALAAGTALISQVNTLNTALTVASQGSSLLQVADGALAQIQTILQRQQAIATSAQSGSLSDTQRGFLDQEFQQLTSEIDQLAGSTNFNGVNLIDGSLSGSNPLQSASNGTTAATAATIVGFTAGSTITATSNLTNDSTTSNDTTFYGDLSKGSFTTTAASNVYTVSYSLNGSTYTGTASTAATSLVLDNGNAKITLTIPTQATINATTAVTFNTALTNAFAGATAYANHLVRSTDATDSVTGLTIKGTSIAANATNGSDNTAGSLLAGLTGANVTIDSALFNGKQVPPISGFTATTAAGGALSSLSVSINGQTYTTGAAGSVTSTLTVATFGGGTAGKAVFYLNGDTSSHEKFTINFAGITTDITDVTNTAGVANIVSSLNSVFGNGSASGSGLSFQVGSSSSDTIGVTIGSATSSSLFGHVHQDVLSQADATTAGAALTKALNTITSLRATVGANEERFNFASSAVQSASQNENAARGTLLDTDVASTSTSFATAQVQLQAGIAVLAQANQLQQNLLKLIA